MAYPAVFLDKDGTLVEDVPYNVDPARMRLATGAGPALARLHAAGFRLVVVSNQSGVARGYFAASALTAVESRLRVLLAAHGVPLAGCYFCPHHPTGTMPAYCVACACRKPQPGLLLRAAREHRIDPARSWLVGDILDDVEAGRRAGCRTILLDVGHETVWLDGPHRRPHHCVPDLGAAAAVILGRPGSSRIATHAGRSEADPGTPGRATGSTAAAPGPHWTAQREAGR